MQLFRRPPYATAAAILAAALALTACGSSASSSTHAAGSTAAHTTSTPAAAAGTAAVSQATVTIHNYMYMPMALTVKAGAKVTFHNEDQTAHTATSIASGFDTGTIEPGKSVTVTLKKPGTYAYHCLFHAFMTAKITVVQ